MKSTASVDSPASDARADSRGAPTALARMLHLRDLRPSQVAKLARCSPSTLSRAVRGEKPLGNRLRGTIAQVLGCDERDLIDGTPSSAMHEAIGALSAVGATLPFPRSFDAGRSDANELEQLALAALGLIRANEPVLAGRVVERLLSKLVPAPSATPVLAYSGRLLEWYDHLTIDHLSPGQQQFLERARSCGGDLTDGVLQPLIDDGCWSRTTVYAATSDLQIRHLATGVNHITPLQHHWLNGRPAADLCAPASLVRNVIADLSIVRDHGGYTVRRATAELAGQTYTWLAATTIIGTSLVAACKLIETP